MHASVLRGGGGGVGGRGRQFLHPIVFKLTSLERICQNSCVPNFIFYLFAII